MTSSANSIHPNSQNIHILIVDDDTSIRILLRTFLEKKGYVVTDAGSGREAIRRYRHACKNSPVDLVLLDFMMPDMDGLAVLQQIRFHSNVPVLWISGIDFEEVNLSENGLSSEDIIQKPFRVQDLENRIQTALYSTAQRIS